jgi:phospholipase/lecithinase/hemolysin
LLAFLFISEELPVSAANFLAVLSSSQAPEIDPPGEFRMSLRNFLAVIILILFALQPIAAHASTPAYSAIYVFGDSYCDVGNAFLATKGADPLSPPYFNGRFTNGPIWVEHVAGALGLPMKPSLAGGTDYAFGGAEVTAPVISAFGSIPSIPQQVALYLSQHNGKADPNALYIIEGGGNDIVNATGGSPQTLGFQIALGIANSELFLRLAGAKNFLIPNLFDVSILPVAKANATFAQQASLATNKSLDSLLKIEQLLEGVRIRRTDVFRLFQFVITDPTHFGFTDITNPCLNPVASTVCTDPDHTLFWDGFHPTEFGHSFFAVVTEVALSQ